MVCDGNMTPPKREENYQFLVPKPSKVNLGPLIVRGSVNILVILILMSCHIIIFTIIFEWKCLWSRYCASEYHGQLLQQWWA